MIEEFHQPTMTGRSCSLWLVSRGLAASVAILVAAFCLGSVAPTAHAAVGCEGHEASGKVCGQSGPSEPLADGVLREAPAQPPDSPAARVQSALPAQFVVSRHVAPSAPRAPPAPRD